MSKSILTYDEERDVFIYAFLITAANAALFFLCLTSYLTDGLKGLILMFQIFTSTIVVIIGFLICFYLIKQIIRHIYIYKRSRE